MGPLYACREMGREDAATAATRPEENFAHAGLRKTAPDVLNASATPPTAPSRPASDHHLHWQRRGQGHARGSLVGITPGGALSIRAARTALCGLCFEKSPVHALRILWQLRE
mmetsp:Transcript_79345/g.224915  ORF Transcript_79345/g.224915 Transcript_79345/m.224915 type:complete len:112 (+) Transcript_79345:443-778(+)